MVQVAGLAGFVDGVFKGMDWAEGLKDRKRARAMEDEEHKWRREQQQWAREDQAAQRDELAFTRSERERLAKFRDDDEAAWNATVDQLKGIGPDGTATAPRRDPMDMPDVAGNQRLGFGIPTREEVEAAQPGVKPAPRPAAPEGVGRLGVSSKSPTAPVVARRPGGGVSILDLARPAPAPEVAPPATSAPAPAQGGIGIMDTIGYGQGMVDPRLARAAGSGQPAPAPASAPAAGVMSDGPMRPANPQAPPQVAIAMWPGEMSLRDAYAALGADGVGYGAGRVDPRLARAATAQVAKQGLEVVSAPGLPEDVILQADGSIIGADSGRAYDRNAVAPLIEAARRPATQRDPSAPGKLAYAEAATRAHLEEMAQPSAPNPEFAKAEAAAKQQIEDEYRRRQAPAATQDAASRRAQGIADAVGEMRNPINAATDALGRGGQRIIQGANTALGYGASAVGATDTGAEAFRRADRYGGYAEQGAPAPAPAQAAAPAPAPDQTGRTSTTLPAAVPASLSFGRAPAAPAGTGAAAAEKAAQTTFGMGIIGEGMPVKTTAARRERAAQAGLRYFNDEAMPAIVERFLRTGRLEEAKAFQEWVKEEGVQAGIRSYMRATHALSLRDTDAAEKHLTDVFNNDSYFDDGHRIPTGGLEIIEGADGKIRRAKLTMVNVRTGERFTQEYSGEDLLALAYAELDPEKVFETAWAAVADPKKGEAGDTLKDLKTAIEILKGAIEAEAKSRGEEYPDAAAILEGYSAAEIIAAAQVLQANPGADIFSLLGDVPVATFE
ncbi:hypothetical protein LAZ40_13280 [Cereibacter sphaeroides]|uniref:hypothetical protein n=1 Tax=Cereibacter sphaeroides TaxID=1063 RepID=UPI001F3B8494|nr:hypothetical protein [Cereibacter sphaeroides]MCE6959994.1 hypothetical protein [Cereibacter sphaeroides]MCE6973079.1 hypothetical protein [Cereibacter sphaeroides]